MLIVDKKDNESRYKGRKVIMSMGMNESRQGDSIYRYKGMRFYGRRI